MFSAFQQTGAMLIMDCHYFFIFRNANADVDGTIEGRLLLKDTHLHLTLHLAALLPGAMY